MKLLVTGGAGFIGSNFIRYWYRHHPGDFITNLDKLTYAGRLENTRDYSSRSDYKFIKTDACSPRTPYNASKAAANHLVMSYYHTFGLPVSISHCSNNYVPFQFPEKLIPRFVTNLIDGLKIPLYTSSHHRREWIHVDDHNAAVDAIISQGRAGEAYNIGTGVEKSIKEIADLLLARFRLPSGYKKYIPDRLGHDRRYLLNTAKIRHELGWQPKIPFTRGIRSTIDWYREDGSWWRPLKSRAESIYQCGNKS